MEVEIASYYCILGVSKLEPHPSAAETKTQTNKNYTYLEQTFVQVFHQINDILWGLPPSPVCFIAYILEEYNFSK